MDKMNSEQTAEDRERTCALRDRAKVSHGLVVRDDQFDFDAVLDAARAARGRRKPIRLVDTGRFGTAELEILAGERARLYTSDEALRRPADLALLCEACRSAGSFVAHFQSGPFGGEDAPLPLPALRELAEAGMDIHVSNDPHARGFSDLEGLAESARAGRSRLVYYHHGPLAGEIAALAAGGAWVHFSDRGLERGSAVEVALEIVRAAAAAGSRAAVHVERGLPLEVAAGMFEAGAVLLFQTAPSDDRSLFRPLERKAGRRVLPVRSYYLSTAFLP